jgi:AAA family ATP:ADP antiporter
MDHARARPAPAATAATAAAFLMIAHQVAGKAARDSLFLSSFPVTALPTMLVVSALLSLAGVLLASRAMARWGPARVIPGAFAASAVLMALTWAVALRARAVGSVLLYLEIAVLGSLLISGFWSQVGETFDPRAAKREIGRIAAGGTLGGLLGGIAAERLGTHLGMLAVLPMLSMLHLLCAVALRVVRPVGGVAGAAPSRASGAAGTLRVPGTPATPGTPGAQRSGAALDLGAGFRALTTAPYLRHVAALVALLTVAAGLLDYVFKARAVAVYEGHELLRFFALFYVAVSLLAFLIQAALSRVCLERLGLARTVALLPAGVAATAAASLAAPGLLSSAMARGLEAVLRNSLFRSGFELFFTPVPPQEKRASKALIDVGVDRAGDAVGGGLIRLVLLVLPAVALPALTGLAVALALAGAWVALRLHRSYVGALERNLMLRAVDVDLTDTLDSTTRATVMLTMTSLRLATVRAPGAPESARAADAAAGSGTATGVDAGSGPGKATGPAAATAAAAAAGSAGARGPSADPLLAEIAALRGGDPSRVRGLLARTRSLQPAVAAHVIPLLARDDLASEATSVLRANARRLCGQIVDALLDDRVEFTVRRRLPRVLSASATPRAVDGLLEGLKDGRFEVRYQCGRALARIQGAAPSIAFERERVFEAVLRETALGRAVWESQRLLDQADEADDSPFTLDVLRERGSRSLQHLFTLLALVYPRQPLAIAYEGLHTSDPQLRGTALEYLESILPPPVRAALWPMMEEQSAPRRVGPAGAPAAPTPPAGLAAPAQAPPPAGGAQEPRPTRPSQQVLEDLLRSSVSIQINLEALRKKPRG